MNPTTKPPSLYPVGAPKHLKLPNPDDALGWAKESRRLLQRATKLLGQKNGRVTNDTVREQLEEGLKIAYARFLAAPDAKSSWQTSTAWKVFLEAWRLLEGASTQNIAFTAEKRQERSDLLAEIQRVLVARGGPRDA